MAPKVQKSKAAKALAAVSGGKKKGKKKWSKGKVREKKMHAVVFDQATFDRVLKEVPKKMKVITVYSLCEQFNINGALARRAMAHMEKEGSIKPVAHHSNMLIYTRAK